jgi:hypothetical protein
MRTIYPDIVPVPPMVVPMIHAISDQPSQEERKRRRRHEQVDEEEFFGEPEESVVLGELPDEVEEPKGPSTRSLLATAAAFGGFTSLLKRRRATWEEQLAAASFSPGCLAGMMGESLTKWR